MQVMSLPMRPGVLAALLMLAMQSSNEEPGLSKGPTDPADIGTRCSVMAGREDRAYLNCAQQARPASPPTGVAAPEQPQGDRVGVGRDSTGRPYPVRTR
jgi:hypothetical protein